MAGKKPKKDKVWMIEDDRPSWIFQPKGRKGTK